MPKLKEMEELREITDVLVTGAVRVVAGFLDAVKHERDGDSRRSQAKIDEVTADFNATLMKLDKMGLLE